MEKIEILPAGSVVGAFKILKKLGSGGSGVVYLAKQMAMDKVVAVKILHQDMAENPVYIRNFVHEARMAAKLDHPNIIQALDVGSSGNICYFAMEYVNGVSLEHIRLKNRSRITLAFVLDVSIALADALSYAWESFRITHGDIKPDNLMIRHQDNMLKLADLGLANVAGTADESAEIMATPLYASPEVIMGKHPDIGVCSDIYSFGIMLYELISGAAPFRGDIDEVLRQHLDIVPPPLEEANPGIDPRLARLVAAMTAKAPADRPASWKEIKNELCSIRSTLPEKTDSPADAFNAPVQEKIHTRFGVFIVAGIVLLCILLGFLFFMLFQPLN